MTAGRWFGLLVAALVFESLSGAIGAVTPWGFWLRLFFSPFLALAILAALQGKAGSAMAVAVVAGLLHDAWFSGWYGESAFCFLVVAFLISRIASRFDLLQLFPAGAALFLGAAADRALRSGLAGMFDLPEGDPGSHWFWVVRAVGTVILGLLVLPLLEKGRGRP